MDSGSILLQPAIKSVIHTSPPPLPLYMAMHSSIAAVAVYAYTTHALSALLFTRKTQTDYVIMLLLLYAPDCHVAAAV